MDDVSPQVEFLGKLILSAQTGDEAAVATLRRICMEAARVAPRHALITLGQCFHQLGIEATRDELGRN